MKPIIFLHGLTGSNQGFSLANWRIYAPILPGHQGVSLTGCQNLSDIADYVFEEIKLQKIKKPVIVGFSLF
jgi:pimeloyl-ACP methyl ester carboxylesterase